MEHLRALCDVLDVSLDEAMKGAAREAKTATQQLVLDAMDSMDPADEEMVLALIMRMGKA